MSRTTVIRRPSTDRSIAGTPSGFHGTVALGLLSIICPPLGPVAWMHAADELDRVALGHVSADHADYRSLLLAHSIAIVTTCAFISIVLALLIGFA